MEIKTAKKVNELLEEINELESYKEIMNKSKNLDHFEFREHYGNNAQNIDIERKHNHKFIKVLDDIINELEQQLSDL